MGLLRKQKTNWGVFCFLGYPIFSPSLHSPLHMTVTAASSNPRRLQSCSVSKLGWFRAEAIA